MFNSLATCLAISFPFVPCSLEIAITKLFVILSFLILFQKSFNSVYLHLYHNKENLNYFFHIEN